MIIYPSTGDSENNPAFLLFRPLLGNHLDIPEKRGFKSNYQLSKEFDPNVDVTADLPTIHEAFQFLMKKYVEDPISRQGQRTKKAEKKVDQRPNRNTLGIPDFDESHKRSSLVLDQFKDLLIDDPFLNGSGKSTSGSKSISGSRSGSRRGSRRGSLILLDPLAPLNSLNERRGSLDPRKKIDFKEKSTRRSSFRM